MAQREGAIFVVPLIVPGVRQEQYNTPTNASTVAPMTATIIADTTVINTTVINTTMLNF